ncbi:hypothetical protein ACLIIZ_20965 [Azonexus caeni]|uniref:hypothetical protein n=1 Tax=Azonexus caeni TaxID=266126 RepID=UPI003A8740F2
MNDSLEWFWGVLLGDFNEEPSMSQTIVSSIITAIPIIDQIADVRDVIANLYMLSKDSKDTWNWIALCITMIGLIPVLGSLLKGIFKILVRAIRDGLQHADEALDMILALVRGAGKGDPVKWLKSLPIDQYAKDSVKNFKKITTTLRFAISDLKHNWLATRIIGDKIRRLQLVEEQIKKLEILGEQRIPDTMRFLKQELDKLLDRAKPAKINGTTDTTNTLAHSAKPLMRIDYEVAVRRRVGEQISKMRAQGKSSEEIARFAQNERRAIGKEFKDATDPDLAKIIYARNNRIYGDPLGPTYEDMRRGYRIGNNGERIKIGNGPKTDEEIIESSQRTGGDDFPWEKIMEYNSAKKSGNRLNAERLLNQINTIVNKKG